jgi:hypothetical protein
MIWFRFFQAPPKLFADPTPTSEPVTDLVNDRW